jgi:hypothetical protein
VSEQLKESRWGLIFTKLTEITKLSGIHHGPEEYRKSNDYKRICQIVAQYEVKYRRELPFSSPLWPGYDAFDSELSGEIRSMFEGIRTSTIEDSQQWVIVLDYLITLKQLSNLLGKNNYELFHEKSKIEAIVEGAPAKVITDDHMRAITSKLKVAKLI